MTKITGSQPEPVKQRIFGSTKVEPLAGASNQPIVLPHTKIYGGKRTTTVRVKMKSGGDDREMLVNEKDFDPARFVRLD